MYKNIFVWSVVIFPPLIFIAGYWFIGAPLLCFLAYFMLNNEDFSFCLRSEKMFSPVAIAYNIFGLCMFFSGFYFSNFKGVFVFLFALTAVISLPIIFRLDKRFTERESSL